MPNAQPQLQLITEAFASAMENTLTAAKLFRYASASSLGASPTNRMRVIERAPPKFVTNEWTDTVTDLTSGVQDRVIGSEVFALNSGVNQSYGYADFARIRDEDQALRSEVISASARDMAEKVDAKLVKFVVEQGNNWIGDPTKPVDTIEALYEGVARAREEGITGNEMFAILPFTDVPKLAKYLLEDVTAAAKRQETVIATFNDGLGRLAGVNVLFTQHAPVITAGTRAQATAEVNTATAGVNYADVCESNTVNGRFMTQLLAIDGLGNGGTINKGEVFTIEGVNAWDNRQDASLGRLQQFTVVETVTANVSGEANVRIFPAIIPAVNATGVNRAHATVDVAPADNADITWKLATAGASYRQRAIIGRTAARVLHADLENLPSGENARKRLKSLPLSVRMHKYSDGNTGETRVRFDMPFTPNTEHFGRLRSIRLNGA